MLQSITVAAEDHRGTQTRTKQTKQVDEKRREKSRLHGYTGKRPKIGVFSLLLVSCIRSQQRGGVRSNRTMM